MKTRKTYIHQGDELSVVLERVATGPPAGFLVEVGANDTETKIAVEIQAVGRDSLRVEIAGRSRVVHLSRSGDRTQVAIGGRIYELASGGDSETKSSARIGSPEVRSPMPGKVLQVLVTQGQRIAVGDDLVILEAMKMENRIRADVAGSVQTIEVADGDRVEDGDLLLQLLPE